MSENFRNIGTLIVVVLKAKNLPNKRHIGKQDPYCVIEFDSEKRRTKAIKRGGQHPEWDEEVRFNLFEAVTVTAGPDKHGLPPPVPPKVPGRKREVRGGSIMLLSCWADDLRDPDLIGETQIDLTEALTKGETDEWFTLSNKDKYCGEVYVELTFWSNEKPPEKPKSQGSIKLKQYGGPGFFVPPTDLSSSSSDFGVAQSTAGATFANGHHQSADPHPLRISNSLARLNLYVAPYEQDYESVLSRPQPVNGYTNETHYSESGHILANDYVRPRTGRTPRHSLPSSSSGFVSLPTLSRFATAPVPSEPFSSFDPPTRLDQFEIPFHHGSPYPTSVLSQQYIPPPPPLPAPQRIHESQSESSFYDSIGPPPPLSSSHPEPGFRPLPLPHPRHPPNYLQSPGPSHHGDTHLRSYSPGPTDRFHSFYRGPPPPQPPSHNSRDSPTANAETSREGWLLPPPPPLQPLHVQPNSYGHPFSQFPPPQFSYSSSPHYPHHQGQTGYGTPPGPPPPLPPKGMEHGDFETQPSPHVYYSHLSYLHHPSAYDTFIPSSSPTGFHE